MGRKGYAELMERNVQFARALAEWMGGEEGGRWFECLNLREIAFPDEAIRTEGNVKARRTVPLNVVLFRAKEVEAVPAVYRGSQFMGNLQETSTRDNETERNKRRALANAALVRDINATKKMYVSPGGYPGGALRIAVSNWMTGRNDGGADLECVKEVLRGVMKGHGTRV
jgi:glutamate/tyrosine decarboxylase-like PLP-dependent enzyme